MLFHRTFWLLLLLITATAGRTQEAPPEPKLNARIFGLFQMWSVYEHGQEQWNAGKSAYEAMDDRLVFLMRRARLGADFRYGERVHGVIITELDQLGPVVLGDPDRQSPWDIGILDAFVSYRIAESDHLHLTAGWFRPQLSRESITGAWAVTSMDKSFTQGFPRLFLTGNPYGRAPGIDLGGIISVGESLHLRYDAGLFSPGNSYDTDGMAGPDWRNDLLITGRMVLMVGDQEGKGYGLGHRINYFGNRDGISIALQAASASGDNGSRLAYGVDLLANLGQWQLDGEWISMLGNGETRAHAQSGHIRLSVNWPLDNGRVLQPFAMYGFFLGATPAEDQALARAQDMYAGSAFQYSAGAVFHIRPGKLWITAQYTMHAGDQGEAPDGSQINTYFKEKGLGAIRRGDWVGIGIHLSLI